jgi:hypothetical protein
VKTNTGSSGPPLLCRTAAQRAAWRAIAHERRLLAQRKRELIDDAVTGSRCVVCPLRSPDD